MSSESPTPPVLRVGRYEIHQEIAAGGMAVVHLGRQVGDAGFSRTVAVKRLHPQFARDPSFVDMLIDEARLASRINHPNVVSPTDVVAAETELFVVMDYVDGLALSRVLEVALSRDLPVPLPVASRIALDLLAGLHAAHEAHDERGRALDLVHRDVSPQNVLVGRDGLARVLDFGIAKARGRLQTTRDGQVKGKLAYLAPELLADDVVDRRTDVYASSVVIWELLAGRGLFRAETEAALLGRVLEATVSPPSRHRSELPPAVDAIVLRGLERSPARRFATADELGDALERALPPAAHRDVAAFLGELAGAELDQQRARVVAMESGDVARSPSVAAPRATVRDRTETRTLRVRRALLSLPSLDDSAAVAEVRPRRRRAVALLGAAVVLVGVSVAVAARLRSGPAAEVLTGAPDATGHVAPPGAEPAPGRAATETSSASSPVTPAASASSAAAVASDSAVSPALRRPAPSPGHARSTRKPAPPTVDCDPPYTEDAQGIRRVKRGCL